MSTYPLISSDSHIIEPPDLWTQRIDRAFTARAPASSTRRRPISGMRMGSNSGRSASINKPGCGLRPRKP